MPESALRSKIRVVNLSLVEKPGTIRAFAEVQVGRSLRINDVKLIQQPGQKPWVAMPSRDYVGADGKKHYAPVVEVKDALKDAITAAVLAAWQAKGGRDHA